MFEKVNQDYGLNGEYDDDDEAFGRREALAEAINEAIMARFRARAIEARARARGARAARTTIPNTIAGLAAPNDVENPDTNVLGECPICQQPMGPRFPVVRAHGAANDPTPHLYHKKCLLQWCSSNRGTTCPECRTDMDCAAINRGDMDVVVPAEIPRTGGRRIKRSNRCSRSCSCRRRSRRRHVKKGRKYTNKRIRRRRI